MSSYLRLPEQSNKQISNDETVRHRSKRSTSAWVAVLLALLGCCLDVRVAHAQSGADKAAAEALFEQARKLMDKGNYAPACKKFEASQQLDSGLGTLLHLADCYEKAKLLASAWGTFEEAASLARRRGENERAQIAAVRAAALKPMLTRVVIRVSPNRPKGLEVWRNGRVVPAASFDVPVPVDEGSWRIRASAPGYAPFEVTLETRSGVSKPYIVNIPALIETPNSTTPVAAVGLDGPAAEPPAQSESPGQKPATGASATEANAGDSQRSLGLLIGGAGVVSAIVSGVFSWLAISKNDESKSDDLCRSSDGPGSNQCSERGVSLRDDALTYAGVATVTGIVGAVAIGAGTTLYLAAPRDEEPLTSGLLVGLKGTW